MSKQSDTSLEATGEGTNTRSLSKTQQALVVIAGIVIITVLVGLAVFGIDQLMNGSEIDTTDALGLSAAMLVTLGAGSRFMSKFKYVGDVRRTFDEFGEFLTMIGGALALGALIITI